MSAHAAVWKFPVEDRGAEISGPGLGPVLKAGHDGAGSLCIWAVVRPGQPERSIRVRVVGTGWSFSESDLSFIDTVIGSNGLVWHVFEEEGGAL